MKKPWHNRPGNIGLTVRQRLVEKVLIDPISGCWNWQAAVNKSGYGKFQIRSHHTSTAHRESYIEFKGPINNGLFVCHACDNKLCINPDHLWLGTSSENIRDAQDKGIMPKAIHPSATHYSQGCRCNDCKLAWYAYTKSRRVAFRKLNPLIPKPIVNQYDREGNFIAQFESVGKMAKSLNMDISSICKVLKGKWTHHKNFVFKYAA